VIVTAVAVSSPTRNVKVFSPMFSGSVNDHRPFPSAIACSSNHRGTSRVMVAFGCERPLITIEASLVVVPSGGSRTTRPNEGGRDAAGRPLGASVPGATVGGVVAVTEVRVGCGVRVGVGLGEGVGCGVAVGASVGEGLGEGVRGGVGAGVSWTNTGSVDDGVDVDVELGTTAISVERPAKTFTSRSMATTVTPATTPPSSQSRRGGGVGRRERPPWTTPL
jgi:hypothetical protein